MIYLCKHCEDCKVYRYERDYNGKPFKFLYCKEGKTVADLCDWFPETHVKGHTSYVRATNAKKVGHNRFHTCFNVEGYIPDHINRNGLDNRFSNLRLLTPRENSLNRTDSRHHPCVYPEGDNWIVKVRWNGKYYKVGKWKDYEQACLNADLAIQLLLKRK